MSNLSKTNNLLPSGNFKFELSGTDFPNLEFFVSSVALPGMNIVDVPTPFKNKIGYVPGDRVDYDQLNLRIAVDEEFNVYKEIYDWIHYNTKTDILKVADGSLSILTSHNNTSHQLLFKNLFPVSMSGGEFNAQGSDTEYVFIDVAFRFDYFTVEKVIP